MVRVPSPRTANRVFQIILAAFLLIALRVWHLEVVQREDKLKQAERPKKRTFILKADRGTICDRFHIPLAVNRICYNASIYYNQIAQIPAALWKEDPVSGKRVRTTPRRDYVKDLSKELGKLLDLEPDRVEDLIYSKASLLPHVPFVIKSSLSEREHYQLAMMEKDWVGVHAEIGSERYYPRGKTASSILGTLGTISSNSFLEIANELEVLQKVIQEAEMGLNYMLPLGCVSFDQAARRFQELKEKSYTIQDLVGKTGIENQYEKELRGYYGKRVCEVSQNGRLVQELSGGRKSSPGQQITLTISAELQEFAEALLAENEQTREGTSLGIDGSSKTRGALKQPWIKGGSIVALDPNTGEILALASTPRFDPNDFIPTMHRDLRAKRQKNLGKWIENERTIAEIWDGLQPLCRERFELKKGFFNEEKTLSWEFFLSLLLPANSPIHSFFSRVEDVKTAVQVQEDLEIVLFHSGLQDPPALLNALYPPSKLHEEIKARSPEAAVALRRLDSHLAPLASNGDRLLAIDLCRLAVYAPSFSDNCLKFVGSLKLSQYRELNQAVCRLEASLKESAAAAFHKGEFQAWRELHQKEFLQEMRSAEEKNKRAPRPYLDYLDRKEKELFEGYWQERRLDALAQELPAELRAIVQKCPDEELKSFLHTFRSYSDLARPLLGSYARIRKGKTEQTEKELASSFYPVGGFGFSRSYAFQSAGPVGSIFKLVTGYSALLQSRGVNPLTLIDEVKWSPFSVATSMSGAPYPRNYKGGRLPKSSHLNIGKIDLAGALEHSSNPYFAILAGDVLQSPDDLIQAARLFGYGSATGVDLPGEVLGNLPSDIKENRTGLYSTAMGQHTLLATPLQSAVMLAAIANGGSILQPHLAREFQGELPDRQSWASFTQPGALAKEELQALGIHFPLFTASQSRAEFQGKKECAPTLIRSLEMSDGIRRPLLDGMDKTIWSSKGTARPGIIRALAKKPELLAQFLSLRHQMIGKTSTAEVLYNLSINPSNKPSLYKHIGFGAIGFEPDSKFERPEIVVVVFLRFGSGGKEAAPLASQVISKWREIRSRS